MWAAIYNFASGGDDEAFCRESVLWYLQTWPLDLINWPVDNSRRQDILYDASISRFGDMRVQSLHTRPPIPANERNQFRWNANPYNVAPNGDGKMEGDPGAWLFPYWLGRFTGLIGKDD